MGSTVFFGTQYSNFYFYAPSNKERDLKYQVICHLNIDNMTIMPLFFLNMFYTATRNIHHVWQLLLCFQSLSISGFRSWKIQSIINLFIMVKYSTQVICGVGPLIQSENTSSKLKVFLFLLGISPGSWYIRMKIFLFRTIWTICDV